MINLNYVFFEQCRMCSSKTKISVNLDDYKAWQNGKNIQNALPYLSDDERELMISQTCGDCWNEIFK